METSPSPSDPPSPTLLPVPELDFRWVHAGSQHLDLLPTPITSASTSYKAFSPDESFNIDRRWVSMGENERKQAVAEWGQAEGEGAPARLIKAKEKGKGKDNTQQRRASVNDGPESDTVRPDVVRSGQEQPRDHESLGADGKYKDLLEAAQQEYEDLELISGVPVSQDSLFEVSLPTLSLHPVFWAHTGPRVSVLRGTWFVSDSTRPCSWDLAEEIEKAYLEIKPWQPSYKHELATAVALGAAGEEKLKYTLPSRFGQDLGIIFDDGERGRLVSSGPMTYLSRTFWSTLRTKSSGTYVYRGFAAAQAASGRARQAEIMSRSHSTSRRGSSSSQRSVGGEKDKDPSMLRRAVSRDQADGKKERPSVVQNALQGLDGVQKEMVGVGETLEAVRKELQDGQTRIQDGLSGDSEKALEEEQTPLVEASNNDAPCTDLILVIHGIGQQLATQYEAYNFVYAGNQLRQVLRKQSANPALASIIRDRRCQVLPVQWRTSLSFDESKTVEDRIHGMDNRFAMADITINKSIPYIRELTNSVLLDIPLFMSHHRQKMIEAVCLQANKLYRLWVARHPDFEKTGRVHIIGHSLGAALVAHILSNQPTKMPKLSQLPRQVITKTRDRFLFNTSSLFLCGSPLGIFFHLDQAQLMPRKGRERTMNSPQDEALDRSGKFGCLAIDSLYNVFYYTDPVAYQLNAVVDVHLAAQRPPLAITSVTAPFFSSVAEGIGSISQYLPTYLGGGAPNKKIARPGAIRLPSGIEMSGPNGEEVLQGTRGERRFSALNPHGNVDFYLPSAGVNEYLDMITAHASYWTDPSFAAFMLAEIFSTRLDLMRTGMGLAAQVMPEGTA